MCLDDQVCTGPLFTKWSDVLRPNSWSREATRLDVIKIVSLWNLTDISAATLPGCLPNSRAIGNVLIRITRLRDVTCGKTPVRLVNKGPEVQHKLSVEWLLSISTLLRNPSDCMVRLVLRWIRHKLRWWFWWRYALRNIGCMNLRKTHRWWPKGLHHPQHHIFLSVFHFVVCFLCIFWKLARWVAVS